MQEKQDESQVAKADEPSKPSRMRTVWLVAGVAVFLLGMKVGEFLIMKYVIGPNKELKAMVTTIMKEVKKGELDDAQKAKYRAILFESSLPLWGMMWLWFPSLFGGAIAFKANIGKKGGAMAMLFGTFVFILTTGEIDLLLMLLLPINAALGFLGALVFSVISNKIGGSQAMDH